MNKRVVITGASGFIGSFLADEFRAEGYTVSTVGRSGDATWDDPAGIAAVVDGASLVIGLAGKSVNCRYGPANRAEILRSRVETTRAVAAAIAASSSPPELWVNSSTATIYRHAEDRPMTESAGELGEGFSVSVARAWEEALFEMDLPATRRVALRTAIVFGDGSALAPLATLARVGLGGAQWDGRWPATRARVDAGTYHRFGARWGRQKFSWIHLSDVLGILRFVRDHPELSGAINASSPDPSDNATVMRTIRRVVGAPVGLPMPRFALELGSAVIRTETELVLKSRWVVPERLLAAGYRFEHPELEEALRSILRPGD
jgi:NAD dependent epimerase/dehydratase family enzyme